MAWARALPMAKKTAVQAWVEYAAVRVILAVLAVLPASIAMRVGVAIGSFAFHLLKKLRRIGMRNLSIAFPEMTDEERHQVLKRAFQNLGRMMATVSRFDRLTPENMRDLVEFSPTPEFLEAYERTKSEGRGRILIGGHMGNWELQAFSYPVFMEPLNFLARKMDNPLIDRMVTGIRTRLGNQQLDKANAASGMMRILRAGGNVGVMADVNSHPKEGVFVPFFDVPACTASGVAMLAMRTNAVIVPMFAIWSEEKGRYFTWFDEVIEPANTGDRKKDIELTTASYVAATERAIREHPDQWLWIHRRWKTRPPGEPSLYD
jgi:Kdo2-lipid IVA lauroyltransferase/acyltransferase